MLRPWNLKLNIEFEKGAGPKYQQLVDVVKQQIGNGTLKAGEALPGSRELAEQLGVSRKTVVTAMARLVEDGWLENRDRVGLFVSESKASKPTATVVPAGVGHVQVPDGFPDTLLLPLDDMGRIYRQVVNRAARWRMMGYADPRGSLYLRGLLAQAMSHERGKRVEANQLLLTRGSQQAFYLIAHALLQPGEAVVMDSPVYENARRAFESAGLQVLPVPADGEGMRMDVLERVLRQESSVRAVLVTPRFHYPTTVTMTNERRRQLGQLSERYGLMIIEDDFDCHFHFAHQNQLPLSSLVAEERFLYIGTFSKIMAPAIRMAMVVADEETVSRLMDYRRLIDIQGDAMMEHTFLQLMELGAMKRHLRKARRVYRERMDVACQLIKQELRGRVEFKRPYGGLSLWVVMSVDPRPKLHSRGIDATVYELPDCKYGLRIGYAAMSRENLEFLVSTLKELLA